MQTKESRWYIENPPSNFNDHAMMQCVAENGGKRVVLSHPTGRANWPDAVKFTADYATAVKVWEALEALPCNSKHRNSIYLWNETRKIRLTRLEPRSSYEAV